MEDVEILDLWKSYSEKLQESLQLNRQHAEDITRLKVKSFLSSMKPIKLFTICTGIVWVVLVDLIIINTFSFANWFFIISAGIQVLLTKIAIVMYLYQLALIHQTDISEPILATQQRLASLKSNTLLVTRILFLQLPVWTTMFISNSMWQYNNWGLYLFQVPLTLSFTWAAGWLFRNINYENRNKRWFRLIFQGREWDPVMKSMALLAQIKEAGDNNQQARP